MAARASLAGAVNEAGIRMITTTDPAEVLRLGTSSAAMVLEADHAVLRLQDEDTQRFVIRSYFGSADGPLQERLFRLDKDVSVDVLRRARRASSATCRGRRSSPRTAPTCARCSPRRCAATASWSARSRSTTRSPPTASPRACSRRRRGAVRAVRVVLRARDRERDVLREGAPVPQLRRGHRACPNAAYLAQRIREETARAGARDGAFAVAVVRIANFAELEAAGDPVKTRRAVHGVVDALRRNAREFDVLTRCENAEFALLIPEPGHDPAQRVLDLARAVSEDVTRDERVNTPAADRARVRLRDPRQGRLGRAEPARARARSAHPHGRERPAAPRYFPAQHRIERRVRHRERLRDARVHDRAAPEVAPCSSDASAATAFSAPSAAIRST
jgi:GGDEF domain-containing protein